MSVTAQAEDSSLLYGLGVFGSAKTQPAEVKTIMLTYQTPLVNDQIIQQVELGVFADGSGNPNRSSSGFGFYSVGLNVVTGSVFVQSLAGAGLISNPDIMLGGHFQFTEELSAGIRDVYGYSIGFGYKHISSAGLEVPNQGRDFGLLRLTIPW